MSSYVDQNLQPGERIEYRARPSRAIVYQAVAKVVVALVVLAVLGAWNGSRNNTGIDILMFFASLGLLLCIVGIFSNLIVLRTTDYAVTDHRVIGKFGAIRRTIVDMLITQIEGVTLSQTIPGRIFRYGAVDIRGTGGRRAQLPYMADPSKFRTAVYERLEQNRLLKGTAAYTLDVRMAPDAESAGHPSPTPQSGVAAGTRFCTECGKGLASTSRFCADCGTSVS